MPDPDATLRTAHLVYAAPARADSVDVVLAELTVTELRLDQRLAFAEAWRLRLPSREPAPPEASLQELIRTARERLRDDRATADTVELGARKRVVGLVKAGVRP